MLIKERSAWSLEKDEKINKEEGQGQNRQKKRREREREQKNKT